MTNGGITNKETIRDHAHALCSLHLSKIEMEDILVPPRLQSAIRHSVFVISIRLRIDDSSEERVVFLFFPDCGHGSVTRTDDRFVRQGKDFVEIGL